MICLWNTRCWLFAFAKDPLLSSPVVCMPFYILCNYLHLILSRQEISIINLIEILKNDNAGSVSLKANTFVAQTHEDRIQSAKRFRQLCNCAYSLAYQPHQINKTWNSIRLIGPSTNQMWIQWCQIVHRKHAHLFYQDKHRRFYMPCTYVNLQSCTHPPRKWILLNDYVASLATSRLLCWLGPSKIIC